MQKRLLASVVAAGLVIGVALASPANATKPVLTGSGSSFANKFVTSCSAKPAAPATVNYASLGSGAGRTAFSNGSVDFGASDAVKSLTLTDTRAGGKYVYVPVVGGPVAFLYNIPGVTSGSLKLDATIVAKIFAGKIKKWNDASIKKLQTAAIAKKLPAQTIRVVFRSVKSGTSANLDAYLYANAKSVWTKAERGDVLATQTPSGRMPAGSFGVEKSSLLVNQVKTLKYSFGYADLSDTVDNAGKPRVAISQLKNAKGEFIAPTANSAGTFLSVFSSGSFFNSTTGAVNLDFKRVVPGAYQLSILTYLVVDKGETTSQAAAVESFAKYLLNTCGPTFGKSLGYAPITGALKTKAVTLAGTIRK